MIQCSVYAFEQSANANVDEICVCGKTVHIGIDVCNSAIRLGPSDMCHLDWFQALVFDLLYILFDISMFLMFIVSSGY